VRRARGRPIAGFVLASLGLVVALGVGLLDPAEVVALYVLVVGALVLLTLTRVDLATEEPGPSLLESELRRSRTQPLRPPELVRIERELLLGIQSAGHLHARLLPLLRAAAAARLATRRRIDLERQPEAARAVLGEEAWELLRPDRPAPADRTGPGIASTRVSSLLDVLEGI
jgi:hypothetical protein